MLGMAEAEIAGVIGEAMGGLRHLTGEPGRVPVRCGISLGDTLAALHGCIGVLTALYHRQAHGGRGQRNHAEWPDIEVILKETDLRNAAAVKLMMTAAVVKANSGPPYTSIQSAKPYFTRGKRYHAPVTEPAVGSRSMPSGATPVSCGSAARQPLRAVW